MASSGDFGAVPLESNINGSLSTDSTSCEESRARRILLNMTQKTMARRMLQSARDIPQFSVSRDLNATQLTAWRARINAELEDDKQRVSMTVLMIWLAAQALRKHPRLNSRFDEDAIIQYQNVNVAVAMETPSGLVVPVIRAVETLSMSEIAQALKDLAARAMAKRLSVSDFANATFTISNLGMMGVTNFRPMVNSPQAAIMGVSGPRISVVLDEKDKLAPVKIMEVTITADHRVLDGAEVARFLQTLVEIIQESAINQSGNK
jgi:pyruvate dehydrogenase E2 component (dihydrolipoamide acetyltransferase)